MKDMRALKKSLDEAFKQCHKDVPRCDRLSFNGLHTSLDPSMYARLVDDRVGKLWPLDSGIAELFPPAAVVKMAARRFTNLSFDEGLTTALAAHLQTPEVAGVLGILSSPIAVFLLQKGLLGLAPLQEGATRASRDNAAWMYREEADDLVSMLPITNSKENQLRLAAQLEAFLTPVYQAGEITELPRETEHHVLLLGWIQRLEASLAMRHIMDAATRKRNYGEDNGFWDGT
jgi:hypothetical protein